jgi:F-type H+-transporting ATPase subunit epsilon
MAESSGKSLRVVVVTPERAVLDEPASFVVLPMYDGEFGVLPGRAAFVGQLGPGELRITTSNGVQKWFVDGGFAQTRADVVNVLTRKASPLTDVTPAMAESAKTAAEALPSTNAVERDTKTKAVARANALTRLAAKAGAAH